MFLACLFSNFSSLSCRNSPSLCCVRYGITSPSSNPRRLRRINLCQARVQASAQCLVSRSPMTLTRRWLTLQNIAHVGSSRHPRVALVSSRFQQAGDGRTGGYPKSCEYVVCQSCQSLGNQHQGFTGQAHSAATFRPAFSCQFGCFGHFDSSYFDAASACAS